MSTYLCAEIDGDAQACARLVNELRQQHQHLQIDQRGFLLIPEHQWDELNRLAGEHQCELHLAARSREAA